MKGWLLVLLFWPLLVNGSGNVSGNVKVFPSPEALIEEMQRLQEGPCDLQCHTSLAAMYTDKVSYRFQYYH